jgi:hypothetical protein
MKKVTLSTLKKSIITKIRFRCRAKVPSNEFGSAAVAIVAMTMVSASSLAMPLVGSGPLPFPGQPGTPTTIGPIYADVAPNSFTGTWNTTAPLAWRGTFTGNWNATGISAPFGTPGRIGGPARNFGRNIIDFRTLPNGVLPKQSFFF